MRSAESLKTGTKTEGMSITICRTITNKVANKTFLDNVITEGKDTTIMTHRIVVNKDKTLQDNMITDGK